VLNFALAPSWALVKKEFKDALGRPSFYVIWAVLILTISWTFLLMLLTTPNLTTVTVAALVLHPTFYFLHHLLLFLVPLMTMGSIAREHASRTMPLLWMAPLTHGQIIGAKFIAIFGQILLMLLPTLVIPLVLKAAGFSNASLIFAHYLALILTTAVYVMLGIMISGVVKNQFLAAFLTAMLFIMLMFMAVQAMQLPSLAVGSLLRYLTVIYHFELLSSGFLAPSELIYFASVFGLSFYGAVKSMDRRWW
jgi:ABC-2 type transport system permease protein